MIACRRKRHTPDEQDSDIARRLAEAEVDLGAIIDYASSFGTVALTRAYADWSVPATLRCHSLVRSLSRA